MYYHLSFDLVAERRFSTSLCSCNPEAKVLTGCSVVIHRLPVLGLRLLQHVHFQDPHQYISDLCVSSQ